MNEKKIVITLITIVIILILGMAFFTATERNEMISFDADQVESVSITEWEGGTETLEEKEKINLMIDYLNSLKLEYISVYWKTPRKWDYRVGISESFEDGSSKMIASLYITKDGKLYKNNFANEIVGFNYKQFMSILSEIKN